MRKEKKYHYIYKTTNLKNGKFYVGMHSTDNLNDGYLGSGTRLRRSIRKYGKENFKIEFLDFASDKSSLSKMESEFVNEDLLKDPLCMNLVFGGYGGYISPDGVKKGGKYSGNLHAERLKNNTEFRKKHINWFNKMKTNLKKLGILSPPNWTGKKHKEETKRKIGEANSIKQKGEGNSQFGTCWITNGTENKKIKKTDKLPKGWSFGRR